MTGKNSKTLNEPKKVQNLSKTSLENNKKPELTTSFYDSTEKIIKPIKRDKNSNDVMFLVKALKDHCLFAFLTENQLEEIVTNSNYAEIPQNTVILKEGDTFQKIYIIDKGTVELTHKNKSIRNSASGAILGDDLVYGNKSFYTAKSLQTCFLWVIDQKILKAIIEGIISKDFQDKISFLESIEFFRNR